MTTESRLGVVEGRTIEHAASIAGLREDLREGLADVRVELRAINARIDRLILALLGGGVTIALAQVGVIVTVVLRT